MGKIHKKANDKDKEEAIDFKLNHTFNDNQIGWFRAGSALNAMAEARKKQ